MTLRYPPKDAFYHHSTLQMLHAEALYRAIGFDSEGLFYFLSFIMNKYVSKFATK